MKKVLGTFLILISALCCIGFSACNRHNYIAETTDPTCTEQGYTTYTCKDCGYTYKDNYTPAKGHTNATITTSAHLHDSINALYCSTCGLKTVDVPVIRINTDGADIDSKEDYTPSSVSLENCGSDYVFDSLPAGVRLRGNSTFNADKKSYRIKFDSKTNILGLNGGKKFKSWVLLADYYDYSNARNYATFFMAENLSFYSSDFTYVEIYVNDVYNGIYLLCEQQQINKGRIDIEEYKSGESDPVDTGYLLEMDFEERVESPFIRIDTPIGYDDLFWNVKSDTDSAEQIEYIKNYMQNLTDIIYGECIREDLEEYVDIDSLLDINVLFLINCDGDPNSSFYVYKDKNEKLVFGAPWDDDWAYGNDRNCASPSSLSVNQILDKLMDNEWYMSALHERFLSIVTEEFKRNIIDALTFVKEFYKDAFDRNYEKWNIWGTKTFKYMPDSVLSFTCHEDAMDYLISWLEQRFEFLETQFFTD